jgi:hypothetical protein
MITDGMRCDEVHACTRVQAVQGYQWHEGHALIVAVNSAQGYIALVATSIAGTVTAISFFELHCAHLHSCFRICVLVEGHRLERLAQVIQRSSIEGSTLPITKLLVIVYKGVPDGLWHLHFGWGTFMRIHRTQYALPCCFSPGD